MTSIREIRSKLDRLDHKQTPEINPVKLMTDEELEARAREILRLPSDTDHLDQTLVTKARRVLSRRTGT